MTGATSTDSLSLRRAWEDHPHYRYRGCAPDVDDPSRMAGDPSLPLGAHHAPDVDGGEGQAARLAREAAVVKVCLGCPVMAACDAYASSMTRDGRLAEPYGIWGARRARERQEAFMGRRHEVVQAAPVERVLTAQQRAVLLALAMSPNAGAVAAAAGVDLRTASWQRSRLVTLLGLARSASRSELLAAAVERGVLARSVVVGDDGSVPAVPPPSSSRSAGPAVAVASLEPPARGRRSGRRVRRMIAAAGQLSFDLSDLVPRNTA